MTTATQALALGKTCAACGKERKSKALKYDPQTFLPYCEHPYICNDDHPNAPKNLILNQKETMLVDFDQANAAYRDHLLLTYANPEVIQKIHRMLNTPITLRIQDPEMAKFLAEFEVDQGFDNMSDTIRYCIQMVKDNRGSFLVENRAAANKVAQVQAAQAAIKEIEQGPAESESELGTPPLSQDDPATLFPKAPADPKPQAEGPGELPATPTTNHARPPADGYGTF